MKSFIYAARGIIDAFSTQRNMRIHTCFAFYVILAGLVCRITTEQWFIVLLCIALVITAELVNTALENVCDALSREKNINIARAKDCAAGAVLVCAALSAAAGCVIFFAGDKLVAAVDFAVNNPLAAAAIVLTLPIWIYIIFRRRNT